MADRAYVTESLNLDDYVALFNQLEANPYSERLFLMLHIASMKILRTHGKREGISPKKRFEFVNDDFGLMIEYTPGLITNFLEVKYIDPNGKRTLDLARGLAGKSAKAVENNDYVTRISRGIGLTDLVNGLFQYSPHSLSIYGNDDNLQKQLVY